MSNTWVIHALSGARVFSLFLIAESEQEAIELTEQSGWTRDEFQLVPIRLTDEEDKQRWKMANEGANDLVRYCRSVVEAVKKDDDLSLEEKLDGVAFSILVGLDGDAGGYDGPSITSAYGYAIGLLHDRYFEETLPEVDEACLVD